MKRLILCLTALLLLCGCASPKAEPPAMQQPFDFYYRTAQTGYDTPDGLIRAEIRDLGPESLSLQELFELYLQGPESEGLLSPFPKEIRLLSVSRSEGGLELRFNRAYAAISGVEASIADACLTKTALQLDGISHVRILGESISGQTLKDVTLEASDILLYDDGEESANTEITLFFSDSNGRYLLADRRTISHMDPAELPQYVVEQLILGPRTAGLYRTLPEGTALLDINVEEGVCAVDFNGDFYANRPGNERKEQLVLLSVVNSLCSLEGVDQVQFYIEGRRQQKYTFLDISSAFSADSAVVGPIRTELNEFDGTVYLPGADGDGLHALRIRIRMTGSHSKEEALLSALLNRPSQNGLENPLPPNLKIPSVTVSEGLCNIDFEDTGFLGDSPENEIAVVRSIVATMVTLPSVTRVQLTVRGHEIEYASLQDSGVLTPEADWYCVNAPKE